MNPYSPEQKHGKSLVERALDRCKQEEDITNFLIRSRQATYNRVQEELSNFDNEVGRAPLILGNGVIIPSPYEIIEHEAQHHAETLEFQKSVLEDIQKAGSALDSALRKHNQNYDHKFEKFVKNQRLRKLKNNSASSSGSCENDPQTMVSEPELFPYPMYYLVKPTGDTFAHPNDG